MTKAQVLRSLVESADAVKLPALAEELARGLAAVLARTATPYESITAASTNDEANTLLTVTEAAARLGVARSWLYRHARGLPFTRKLGHRTLRFDARGLESWARTRPAT